MRFVIHQYSDAGVINRLKQSFVSLVNIRYVRKSMYQVQVAPNLFDVDGCAGLVSKKNKK